MGGAPYVPISSYIESSWSCSFNQTSCSSLCLPWAKIFLFEAQKNYPGGFCQLLVEKASSKWVSHLIFLFSGRLGRVWLLKLKTVYIAWNNRSLNINFCLTKHLACTGISFVMILWKKRIFSNCYVKRMGNPLPACLPARAFFVYSRWLWGLHIWLPDNQQVYRGGGGSCRE